jgi:hypothetical protein
MATQIYRIDAQWHKKEQYPFLEIDGLFSIAEFVVVLKQIGRI